MSTGRARAPRWVGKRAVEPTGQDAVRRRMRNALRLWSATVLLLLTMGATSCGVQCRETEVRPLELSCDLTSGFVGEVHFDSAATFDTFLRQQCMLSASDAEVQALLDAVDFRTEAVFVAVGPDAIDDTRCLASRDVDTVSVCSDGLKIGFTDTLRTLNGASCPGTDWTIAFVIDRDALRTALNAAETSGQ